MASLRCCSVEEALYRAGDKVEALRGAGNLNGLTRHFMSAWSRCVGHVRKKIILRSQWGGRLLRWHGGRVDDGGCPYDQLGAGAKTGSLVTAGLSANRRRAAGSVLGY